MVQIKSADGFVLVAPDCERAFVDVFRPENGVGLEVYLRKQSTLGRMSPGADTDLRTHSVLGAVGPACSPEQSHGAGRGSWEGWAIESQFSGGAMLDNKSCSVPLTSPGHCFYLGGTAGR